MLNAAKLIIPTLVLLALASPQSVFSQDQATATNTTLEKMADQLAAKLPDKHLRIVVLDFSAPDDRSLPFGAYLADEFSAALVRHGGPFGIADRKKLAAALDSLHLLPEKEFDYQTSLELAKSIGADCIVRGSYGEFNGGLGITVTTYPGESHLVNGKLSLSPEMASHLGEPLQSLRTKGSAPLSGTAGMTLVKCIECPNARYDDAAAQAKLEGTVILTAIVTPDGRATSITIIKGVDKGLDKNAISAVKNWRFAPALDPDGKPVAVTQKIQCTFHLY
jgi:TonB family protein